MTTWNQLTKLEPRLADLEQAALAAHRNSEMDWRAWAGIKRRLSKLVGWWSENPDPQLRRSDNWNLAYGWLLYCFEKGHRPRARGKGKWPPQGHPHALPSPGMLEEIPEPERVNT